MEEGFSSRELKIPIYFASEALEQARRKLNESNQNLYPATYSSIFGGITLDPALMLIPLDDHMVHRGHGVFDTTVIIDGCLYLLDAHLDRLQRSASKAKISAPFPYTVLRSILIQLVAASKCKNGCLRFWLSPGPGDFFISPAGCLGPAFYAVVVAKDFDRCTQGATVITSTVPMKPPLFATTKNVNYMPNVLSAMEAEEKGAFAAIWVDQKGHVAEGYNVNVAFITKGKELVFPPFNQVLAGCTAKRLLQLAPALVEKGVLNGVVVREITVEEGKNAAEMMCVGSMFPIVPVIAWDDQPIGDGRVGAMTLELSDLLWEDMIAGPGEQRIRVHYE